LTTNSVKLLVIIILALTYIDETFADNEKKPLTKIIKSER